ncbi:Acid phosphatase 1 [Dichanthelium oligosanthes]|uniref:Acid phosphatase 1 n=1 Tax=Dichanthelium oligosanthes TaxID=888268 RepID=A0A1E5V5C6_9POAL|nr:Acid phosphatase 1 [Dichanthelium oligosanthes]
MARRGSGLVRLLVTLLLLLLATLLTAAAAEVELDIVPAAPAQNASEADAEAAPAQNAFEAEAEAAQQQHQQPPPHLLPRPLIIELPSKAAARAAGADEVPADAVVASLDVDVELELVPAAVPPQNDVSEEEEAVAAAAATAVVEQQQQQHVLPRQLAVELPSPSAAAAARGGDTDKESPDDVPADVRCSSWRLAAEANNLAPWKTVPAECAAHVRDYVTGVAYRSDQDLVARESAAYARAAAPLAGDGRDAWVFDVDETLLSNLPYYAEHGYGLELFDHHKFDRWVERGEARAIPSSLKLYNEVRELGFKTFLLTGRSEGHQVVTAENLKKQGFHDWDKLILRAAGDREKTATIYKSEKRKEMEEEGYRIIGNSGDQWSDLLGSSMSARSFKLPNPMYYIP